MTSTTTHNSWLSDEYVCHNCGTRVHGYEARSPRQWAFMSSSRLCRLCRQAGKSAGFHAHEKPDFCEVTTKWRPPPRPKPRRPHEAKPHQEPVRLRISEIRPAQDPFILRCTECGTAVDLSTGDCWYCSSLPPADPPIGVCDICGGYATTAWSSGFCLCERHARQTAHLAH